MIDAEVAAQLEAGCTEGEDGHLIWGGGVLLTTDLEAISPEAASWWREYGTREEEPESDCGVRNCVAAAHLRLKQADPDPVTRADVQSDMLIKLASRPMQSSVPTLASLFDKARSKGLLTAQKAY